MFTYDHFEVGRTYGSDEFEISQEVIGKWLAVYPDDDNGAWMPPGMTSMIQLQAYINVITPRPKGNVHGSQRFEMLRLPRVGERLLTAVSCTHKEIRKERRWVETSYSTAGPDGSIAFKGVMTTLVAA